MAGFAKPSFLKAGAAGTAQAKPSFLIGRFLIAPPAQARQFSEVRRATHTRTHSTTATR